MIYLGVGFIYSLLHIPYGGFGVLTADTVDLRLQVAGGGGEFSILK